MNSQDLRFDFVDRQRPEPPQFWGSQTPPEAAYTTSRPSRLPHDDGLTSDTASQRSVSPQPTIVPFAPTPPWESTSTLSHPEQYGDTRVFGFPYIDNRPPHLRAQHHYSPSLLQQLPPAPIPPPAPLPPSRLEASRAAMDDITGPVQARGFRDELTTAAYGSITPGCDDGPTLGYALDALTNERWPVRSSTSAVPTRSHLTAQGVHYDLPDDYYEFDDVELPRSYKRASAPEASTSSSDLSTPQPARTRDSWRGTTVTQPTVIAKSAPWMNFEAYNTTPPLTPIGARFIKRQEDPSTWDNAKLYPISDSAPHSTRDGRTRLDKIDPGRQKYPHINYIPRTLRLSTMILLMILHVIMIALLMTSAVTSTRRPGLMTFDDSMGHGQYFLFRILPQMLAALIYTFTQCVMTTTRRILPFATMADDHHERRRGAMFRDLYARSFLLPDLTGPLVIKFCQFVFWASIFTIPLGSSLFTAKRIDGAWTWVAVQPVCWLVIIFYFVMLGAVLTMAIFWHGRHTGLLWDPRTLADIAHMIYKSNSLGDFKGTERMEDRKSIEAKLYQRHHDKLGYWHSEDPQADGWYGIGTASVFLNRDKRDFEDANPGEEEAEVGLRESLNSLKSLNSEGDDQVRRRHMPWSLRNIPMFSFAAGGTVLLVVLIAVSFMDNARWMQGFSTGALQVYPSTASDFSAANFVWSFIPALIATVLLHLPLQSLDQTLRVLQPWAELNNPEGSPARKSILVDYAACSHPLQAALHAARNRHWRVAAVALMASVSLFIPILAGGLFMARYSRSTDATLIFPSQPVFYLLLALLILCLFVVLSLLPKRSQFRLPHAVTSLAEIISFLNTSDVKEEQAFQFPYARTRTLMLAQLGAARRSDETKWYFGSAPGREDCLGVRRLRKFTEKKPRRG